MGPAEADATAVWVRLKPDATAESCSSHEGFTPPRAETTARCSRERSRSSNCCSSALAGLTSVMVVMMLAQPRIFLAMSRDGLLPAWASRVHPRFHTPHISTLVTGVAVAAVAGLTPIGTLGGLVSIGTLMAFVIVSIGVVVQRRTRPDRPRPFRMPLVPFLPILSAVVSLVLMLGLPRETWERLIIWMVLGVGLYFSYGYRRSRLSNASRIPAAGW